MADVVDCANMDQPRSSQESCFTVSIIVWRPRGGGGMYRQCDTYLVPMQDGWKSLSLTHILDTSSGRFLRSGAIMLRKEKTVSP